MVLASPKFALLVLLALAAVAAWILVHRIAIDVQDAVALADTALALRA